MSGGSTISGNRKARLDSHAHYVGSGGMSDDQKRDEMRSFARSKLNHRPTEQEIEDYLNLPETRKLLNIP
jgi:hypothetical protein